MKKSKNVASLFLNELIALSGNENIELAPGFKLRKANENEISLIKRSIPYISSITEENPFETYNATNGLLSQKFLNSVFMYSIIEFEFDLPLVRGEFHPPFFIEALALSSLRLNVLALFFYTFEVEYDDYEVGFQQEPIRGYTLFNGIRSASHLFELR